MREKSPTSAERETRSGISGWSLRRKLALALAFPLALAALFGALRVQSDLATSADAAASAKQVTVLEPAIDYIAAIEGGMIASQSTTGSMLDQRDKYVTDLKAAADKLKDKAAEAELTTDQQRQVASILDLSQALRDDDADTVSGGTWVAQGRQAQSGVIQLITQITAEQNDPEPRLNLVSRTLNGRFALAMQQAIGQSPEVRARGGKFTLFGQIGAESAALDRLVAEDSLEQDAVRKLRGDNAARARQIRTGDNDILDLAAFKNYDRIQNGLLDAVSSDLDATASEARNSAILSALLTLAALAAAVVLAMLVSRALLGPIERVREGALRVARTDLPDAVARIRSGAEPEPITPIDVTSHEEVGQLARAVDDLHAQAVTLASGEASLRSQVGDMFVTLSRRSTSLINQQLTLIEGLERDEQDPKRLEHLFRLDHLASRMRRTSDSLLILADAPQRSAGWEAITIGDVLQAATAGVQDYRRVRLSSAPQLHVKGSAAGDLVHLVTELVDNSLSYSSPTTSVTLNAEETDAGVTISVVDAGLGIPAAQLAAYNEGLSGGAEVTSDTARRMGLFVVSRLAARHQLTVRLTTNDGGGTTAYVAVPNAILRERAHLGAVAPNLDFGAEASPTRAEPAVAMPADDRDRTDAAEDAPLSRGSTFIEEDPLGLGAVEETDHDAPRLLPTRERGATLTHLNAMGEPIPGGAAENGRDIDRRASGQPEQELDRQPSLASDSEQSSRPAARRRSLAALKLRGSKKRSHLTPVPGAAESVDADASTVGGAVVGTDAAGIDGVGAESTDLVTPDALGTDLTPEQEAAFDAEAHIAELMARIRPTHGRLPIPDYEDVDHQSILDGTAGARGEDPPAESESLEQSGPTSAAADSEPVVAPNGEPAARTLGAAVGAPDASPEGLPEWHDDPLGVAAPDAAREPAAITVGTAADSGQSSWLSTDESARSWESAELEAGWDRAENVAETHEETNELGLPVRQPGARLVPGSVTKPVGAAGRDPEVIRARLSAHKTGVRRGRTDSHSTDEQ